MQPWFSRSNLAASDANPGVTTCNEHRYKGQAGCYQICTSHCGDILSTRTIDLLRKIGVTVAHWRKDTPREVERLLQRVSPDILATAMPSRSLLLSSAGHTTCSVVCDLSPLPSIFCCLLYPPPFLFSFFSLSLLFPASMYLNSIRVIEINKPKSQFIYIHDTLVYISLSIQKQYSCGGT